MCSRDATRCNRLLTISATRSTFQHVTHVTHATRVTRRRQIDVSNVTRVTRVTCRRQIDEGSKDDSRTMRVGCTGFMAPETYRELPCEVSADVFAFGKARLTLRCPPPRPKHTNTPRRTSGPAASTSPLHHRYIAVASPLHLRRTAGPAAAPLACEAARDECPKPCLPEHPPLESLPERCQL